MAHDHLLSSYEGPGLSTPNRVALAPLTRNRAKGTVPGPLNAEYYGQRATGALVISEGTHPAQVGQGYIDIAGLHTDEQQAGWAQVADAVHARGGKLFIQLMHCGRIAHEDVTGGLQPVAPTAIRADAQTFGPSGQIDVAEPRALETDELPGVVQDYVQAAERAIAAGADGVELHAANGYLLAQFIAKGSNQRTDEYGGSIEGRNRFVVEVAAAVVAAIGAERVGIRLSPANGFNDIDEGGESEAQYADLIPQLDALGLVYLHVIETDPSAGFSARAQARELFSRTLVVNGGFGAAYDWDAYDKLVADGGADLVAIGRAYIANPDLPERLGAGAELNDADDATFYGGDAHGYTDYPALADVQDVAA